MKNARIFAFIVVFILPICLSISAKSQLIVLEDFTQSKIGVFPDSWEARNKAGENLYLISEDKNSQNKYLSVTDRGESIQIGKRVSWDIKDFQILEWSWRVIKLPEGAREDDKTVNDSAAGIYVIFDNAWLFIPRTIKYVWSTTLKKGTVIQKGYNRTVVLRSGSKDLKKWIVESVNVYEDYKRFFGKEPPNPRGIAILTDANATNSIAAADYDSFEAHNNEAVRKLAGQSRE